MGPADFGPEWNGPVAHWNDHCDRSAEKKDTLFRSRANPRPPASREPSGIAGLGSRSYRNHPPEILRHLSADVSACGAPGACGGRRHRRAEPTGFGAMAMAAHGDGGDGFEDRRAWWHGHRLRRALSGAG